LHRINLHCLQEAYSKIRVWTFIVTVTESGSVITCNELHCLWASTIKVCVGSFLVAAANLKQFWFCIPTGNTLRYTVFFIFYVLHWSWCLCIADTNLMPQQQNLAVNYCWRFPVFNNATLRKSNLAQNNPVFKYSSETNKCT